MGGEQNFFYYFYAASPVVKMVILILFLASLFSWTFIIQRGLYLQRMKTYLNDFENRFWSGGDLTKLYLSVKDEAAEGGLSAIFVAGFKEFIRLQKQMGPKNPELLKAVQRAMRIAHAREMDKLENNLPFLASVGSVSPYIGLFGTVWGIMSCLKAFAQVQQATIALVAPGISETLFATAMGLFAAIPAVLAYNRYVNLVGKLENAYLTFQEELVAIIERMG